MDVARLNFSHGTRRRARGDRPARARGREPRRAAVAVLQDLPGPKLRIGQLRDGIAELKPGDEVTFVCGEHDERGRRAADVHHLGRPGRHGRAPARSCTSPTARCACGSTATRPGDGEIDAVVEVGGTVASRQGLNIPGETAALPSVPEEDLEPPRDRREDRRRLRGALVRAPRRGHRARCAGTRALPLIAKIEKPQAVERAEEILRAADCVMVARGDLGIEMRIEEVPIVQKQIIALAGALARPVITATQMLDSMVASSRPTRAEVTDVANAILDGTDAVMLSQESAVGAVPGRRGGDDGRDRRAHGADRALPRVERAPRAPRPARSGLHARLHRLPRGARARPRGARLPDAVRPLGAADLRAPPDGADLRALPRQRDRPPLRADVGRAGGLDARATRSPRS